MKFTVHENIFTTFDAKIGVVIARSVSNRGESAEVAQLLRNAEELARKEFGGLESVGQHKKIKSWRVAYRKFGSDPHQYRCSVEALARRVLKGDEVPRINTLVDLYNYISLKYVIPVGGEDLDAIQGDIMLAFAEGVEPFIRIGGGENEPPDKGEVVYKDNKGALCRRWNWREAERTKLTGATTNAVLVVEALSPVAQEELAIVIEELGGLIQKFCGGDTARCILTRENREISLHDEF